MNVLTVGIVCIAAYALLLLAWLRYDKNTSGYATTPEKGERP